MTLRETIEPCPFCRSAPKVGYMGDEDGGYAYVECSKPDHFAGSHMETEAEAITAWNTRSLPEIAKITEALEPFAALPCETRGAEDMEAGCCAPCRAREALSLLKEREG